MTTTAPATSKPAAVEPKPLTAPIVECNFCARRTFITQACKHLLDTVLCTDCAAAECEVCAARAAVLTDDGHDAAWWRQEQYRGWAS